MFQYSIELTRNPVIWKSRHEGRVCDSLNDLASSSECIVLCVGNDEDVKDIINGKSGIIDTLNPWINNN
jgi:3-hydroxyisobutyrate dehydrogenase-like beta-hydroxyacid dehydrogenase